MRLMPSFAAVCAAIALPLLITPQQPFEVALEPGKVLLVKRTSPEFDRFTNASNSLIHEWMRDRFWRMLVYSPNFDRKTSWYSKAWIYVDSYAIYTNPTFGENLADLRPEWVLRDDRNSRLYIPWGCDNVSHTCPQYAGDFSNPEFRRWWIDKARASLGGGKYKGLWIDDVNFDLRISYGDGSPASPIDPNTGLPMTVENWRRYLAEFLEQIRSDLPDIELVTNSIWYAGGPARDNNPYVQRQIAASDIITIEHGVNDRGITGGEGDWSLNALLGYIDRVNKAGKSVLLGGLSGIESSGGSAAEYTIACYFLISNGRNAVADFGMAVTPENWPPVLDVNLGDPQGARYAWAGLIRRDFERGMVLVNPPRSPERTIALPEIFRTAGNQDIQSVTLGPAQGVVLQK